MKLYFIRHAQRGHGKKQDVLTKYGVEQVQKLAKCLSGLKVDKIICSSSKRAIKTAEPIATALNVSIEFTNKINERSLGIFQGRPKEGKVALQKSGLTRDEFRPEKGENALDAYNRAKEFVEQLKKRKEKSLLIVSHSGFISDVAIILLKKAMNENKNFKSGFCALTYFELDNDFKVINYKINQKEFSPLRKNMFYSKSIFIFIIFLP